MKKIYLAAPYSHPDPEIRQRRTIMADHVAAKIMQQGYVVFSPLSHSHRIAHHIGNHLSHDFWLTQDLEMLAMCDEMWILTIPGYSESKGIKMERDKAAEWGKPVKKVDTEGKLDPDYMAAHIPAQPEGQPASNSRYMNQCPECGGRLIPAEGCAHCPACGYGHCG